MLSWCVQELNYKEDPEDGLFWMDKNDFFNHYWTMSVCMVNTNGRVSADKLADKRQAVVSKDKPQAGKLVEARMAAAYRGNLERTSVGGEDEGKSQLQQNPDKYMGLFVGQNVSFLVDKGCSFDPTLAKGEWIRPIAQHAGPTPAPTGALFKDQYTDGILRGFERYVVKTKRIGRGEGLHDGPGLKLFSDIDPSDAQQRGIGDCWLMCSFSAVAEFDGMIADLFEQSDISSDGKYTIKLFDLPSKVPACGCRCWQIHWLQGA